MSTDDFWMLVRRRRGDGPGDASALAALTRELERLGEPTIAAFERHVHRQVALLDTPELREVATQLWVFSDDAWLHFRAWCVSRGEEFVTELIAQPGRTLCQLAAKRGGPFDVPNGEIFLYCAEYARVARTKAVA
jgi:hypothetical protein